MIEDLHKDNAGVVAVVPMKPLHLAKTRLAGELDSSRRAALAMGMFAKVVTAALESELAEVWVIGGDFPASERSRYPGVRWLDDPGMGLNEALTEAMKVAAATGYASLYLPADLPFLRSSDIAAILSASDGGSKLTLAAAHHDGGTNAMLVPAQSDFGPLLGNDSFRRHIASARALGLPYATCDSPGFALDLDTPTDLMRCEGLEPGFLESMTSQQNPRWDSREMTKTKLGVLLPTRRLIMTGEEPQNIETVLSMAEQVESAGLDSVWVGDSLTAKPRLEPLTTLAAIASRTSRVRLGTSVLLAALRHPVTLAHVLGSLDLISSGRLIIGAGVGGAFNDDQRQEWRNAGVDPRRRAGRFEEVVDVAKRLTAGEVVTHKGSHFEFESLRVQPHALREGGVPFLMACHWNTGREAQFRRAARLGDGIMSISDYPEEYAKLVEAVQGYAPDYGKDPSALERTFYMTVNLQTDEVKADADANQFLNLYYGMNFWGDRWGPYGHPERTIERMRRYVEAGAETIVVRFAALDQERQLDTFLSEVVPAFA